MMGMKVTRDRCGFFKLLRIHRQHTTLSRSDQTVGTCRLPFHYVTDVWHVSHFSALSEKKVLFKWKKLSNGTGQVDSEYTSPPASLAFCIRFRFVLFDWDYSSFSPPYNLSCLKVPYLFRFDLLLIPLSCFKNTIYFLVFYWYSN